MDNRMFNMTSIGIRISRLRKAADITQMELADRLGISFQAVSNWERGVSMPDISKLGELSEIFGVSIDEMLENKRASGIVTSIGRGEIPEGVSAPEIAELAPVLPPKKVDEMASRADMSLEDIICAAPFLSDGFLNGFALELFKKVGLSSGFTRLAPFLDDEVIDDLAGEAIKAGGIKSIICIAPYMSEDKLAEIAVRTLENGDSLKSICGIAPFLPEEFTDGLIAKRLEAGCDISEIACVAPFASNEALGKAVAGLLKEKGIKAVLPLLPFVDENVIESYLLYKRR